MAKLSARQIGVHAAAAGFRGADLQTSIAVALAESGGDPSAHALTSREDSRGLWQINVRAHPELSGNLYDPATNARAARAVLRKQGWGAWSVFKSGKFLLYMPVAGVAVRDLPAGVDTGDPAADALAGPVDALKGAAGGVVETGKAILSVGELAAKAGTWMAQPGNWLRVMYVVLGGMLVVGALVVVAAPLVTNAVPAGKAIKTVRKLAG